jgi:hypothetical protein
MRPVPPTLGRRAPIAVQSRAIAAPVRKLPPLEPLALAAPDPLDESQYPGDPEGDAKVELTQVQAGFRERMAVEKARFARETTVDHYFIVVCNSGQQAEALMKGLGVDPNKVMADGRIIANNMGIAIPPDPAPARLTRKVDARLQGLVRKV